MIAFIKAIMTFVLHPTKMLKSSSIPPHRCYIHSFANFTRKDVLDDLFGFMVGAVAAETVISSVRFIELVERNRSIEKIFDLLDTI